MHTHLYIARIAETNANMKNKLFKSRYEGSAYGCLVIQQICYFAT